MNLNIFTKAVLAITCTGLLLASCNWDDADYGNSVSVPSPGVAMDPFQTETLIYLTANCPWSSSVDFSSGEGWCELNPSTGMGSAEIKVVLEPNTGEPNRSATVTFRAQDELGQTISYVITQRGTAYYFSFDGTVNDGLFEVAQEAATVSFGMTAGTGWTAEKKSGDNGWLTLKKTSGDKGEFEFDMEVLRNDGVRPRNAEVVFTSTENPANTATVTVRQLITLAATTATVSNGDELKITWNSMPNASSYEVVIRDADTQSILYTIEDLGSSTLEADILKDAVLESYTGPLAVEVKTYFENDPELYSYSDAVITHSHFADGSGTGTSGSEYLVSSARHLQNISYAKAGYYRQTADIDCSAVADFSPIGDANSPFTGSYTVAGGYKISGLDITAISATSSGLFGYVSASGSISGIVMENCSLTIPASLTSSNRNTGHGLVAGISRGKISSVSVINSFVTGTTASENRLIIGGVVGSNYEGEVNVCSVRGGTLILYGQSTGGGVVGFSGHRGFEGNWNADNSLITGCRNYGMEVDGSAMNSSTTNTGGVGGIVGGNEGRVSDCVNEAKVVSTVYAGGIVGTNSYDRSVGFSGPSAHVERCYNTGRIEGRWAAGIVAGLVQNSTSYQASTIVEECFNTGHIQGNYTGSASNSENHIAGIVGRNYAVIRNCYNTGTIDGNGNSNTGGLCGDAYKNLGGIYNCYNTGTVTNGISTATGAVAGYIAASGTAVESIFLEMGSLAGIGSASASKVSDPAKVVKCTDSQMKTPSTYSGWDTSVWNITNGSYPSLKNNQPR